MFNQRRIARATLCLLLCVYAFTFCFGQSVSPGSPTALPYTMTTIAGLAPTTTTANSACPTLPSAKATDGLGDGCPAVHGVFGPAGRGGVVVDAYGNIFVADDVTNYAVIHMIDSTSGIMSKVAGGGAACSSKLDAAGDGCLAATQTVTSGQRGIGIDPYGNILLAGYSDNLIHVVCRAASPLCTSAQIGYMELIAGCSKNASSSGTGGAGLDNVPALKLNAGTCTTSLGEVYAPRGVTADRYGNVFFADTSSSRTRVVLGPLTSSYFSGTNPLYAALGVYYPSLTAGYAYTVVNVGGTGTSTGGAATTQGQSCSVTTNSVTYTGSARDTYGDGCPLEFSSVAASSGYTSGVAVDAAGNMVFTDPTHGLRVFFVQGWPSATAAASAGATGAVATAGVAMYNAIVANNSGVTPQAGFLYMLAGGGATALSSTPTLGTNTSITDTTITKLTVSPQGHIYIGDSNKVLFFDINTGYIRTLFSASSNVTAGNYCSGGYGQQSLSAYSDGCPAAQSQFSNSSGLGVAVDAQGNLYLYDAASNSSGMLVRKVLAQGLASQTLGTPLTQSFQLHLPESSSGSVSAATASLTANPDASVATPTCLQNGDNSVDCTVAVTVTPSAVGPSSTALTVALPAGAWENASATVSLGGSVSGSILAVDGASATSNGATTPIAPTTSTVFSGISAAGVASDGSGNIYAIDTTSGSVFASLGGSTSTITTSLPQTPKQIAVDRAGNLFLVGSGTSTIQELAINSAGAPATYTTRSLSYTPISGTATPQAIAVDDAGNLFVADYQGSPSNNAIYRLASQGNAWQAQTTIATGFSNPVSLAVDDFGNVYVADKGASVVYKLSPSGTGAYTQTTLSNSVTPQSIAVDAAGDVYVQDLSSGSVIEIPVSGPSAITVLTGLSNPTGLALDGHGNVYSADAASSSITKVVRSAVAYNFGTDETITFNGTITNAGNAAITGQNLSTNISNFNVVGGANNGCAFNLNELPAMTAGQSCTLAASLIGSGTATVTDAITFVPSSTTFGSLTLTGTLQGTSYTTTTSLTANTASPVYSPSDTEATFTVTVAPDASYSGSGYVNGHVTVTIDSTPTVLSLVQSGTAGVATMTVSGLSAGQHTIQAVYPTSGTFTGSSSTTTTFTIAPITTAVTWSPASTTQYVSTALGTGVLNATVSPAVAGNFVYTAKAAGSNTAIPIDSASYLPIGTYSLAVTFTPVDSTNYATSTANIGSFTIARANAVPAVGASTMVVAADGSGNFTDLSSALAALPVTGGTIYLAPGTYPGQNTVSYPNVSLRGLGGDPTKVILTAEDGAFSAPFVYPGSGKGNANASGDQGSSTLNVAKSAYIGNQSTAGGAQYTPYNFYAEYLTVQNTYNTSTTTTTTYSTASGSCADTGVSHTLQYLYNAGQQCNSQALALWITADQAILNNVNLTSQQDTLYAGSQGCTSSTCTPARQYMWKGMITGNVDYVFGDSALAFDRTTFFTTWHGTSASGTETIEAQNKKFQTGSSGDYLSGYICNSCTLLSQSTGMNNLYYGRPYGAYSTWIMLNSYVDQVHPLGWTEFSGQTNLPTSTYAEYNTQPYSDPAVGVAPYPATLFGGTVTPTGGNSGAGVTGTREVVSTNPGTIQASNTVHTTLTAAQAAQYYPGTFLSGKIPTQSYIGFTPSWNPAMSLAAKVNSFVPSAPVGTLTAGSSVTILGRPQTPGAGIIPTGAYAFYDSPGTNQVCSSASSSCAVLASGNLDASGEAYLTTNALAAGSHYITMVYGGDANFNGGTSAVYQVYVLGAGQTATATTLSINNTSSTTSNAVTGSVTVTPSTAAGAVSLVMDGTVATTCTLSGGSCSWSLNGVAAGTHALYASYSGSGQFGMSTSASATISVMTPVATGDTRAVSEPTFPAVCQQLTATLTTNLATQDLDSAVDATVSNPDGGRIQSALNSCSATAVAANTNLAVQLSMDSAGTHDAFLTGPLQMPSNVTLLVDPAVTLYFSRNVQDYDKVAGTHTCGTINSSSNTGSCLPLIEILKTSSNVGIMGYGKLNGRGNAPLLNAFATPGYTPPSTYTWWNLASQANGEGNQQNPRFIQMDSGSSNVTLYKISVLNSPNFHISTTGKMTNFTAWGVKIVTPTSARNTDGIDPGNMQNGTITQSWISDGDDNVAIGAPNVVAPVMNISVTNSHFFAGHGASIGSYTSAGVSNVLFDGITSAGNAWVGYGSAAITGVADTNSTAIHIKSANDRGGLLTGIQYSNSCFLDHKTDIQITPYYSSGNSTTLFPNFKNILMQNLVFLNDASSQGTVELTGEFNSNATGGTPITNPLGITLDNVTFPSTLSSLVNSTNPAESTSVWGTGNYSGGTGQYVNLTVGPGQVSSNFLSAYMNLVNNGVNNDTLTNNIVQTSLNPPSCVFTYLAPELTGPTGLPQTISYGNSAKLIVILTPAVGGASYPNGVVTLKDALTGNTFQGTFPGTGDTIAVTIPASNLTVGTHTFSAISYTGDTNYTVPPAYQNFGSYTVTVTPSTPRITAWPTASSLTYGQSLSSSILTGGAASVEGSFAFTSPATSPGAGTTLQSVTFTPANTTNYVAVSGTVNVTVAQATPTIAAWPTASAVSYGQPLSASTLTGGRASVPGSFAFASPAFVPPLGATNQSVVFTPTDAANYGSVVGVVSVSVNKGIPALTLTASSTNIVAGNSVVLTATVSSSYGIPSGLVNFLDGGTLLGSGALTGNVSSFSTAALSAGTHNITAMYSGDNNFASVTSGALVASVVSINVGSISSVSSSGGSGDSSETVAPGGTATYYLPIQPSSGSTFPAPLTLTLTGVPSGATVVVGPSGWTQSAGMTWILPANTAVSGNTQIQIKVAGNSSAQSSTIYLKGGMGPIFAALLLLPFGSMLRSYGGRMTRLATVLVFAVAALISTAGLLGCGGGGYFGHKGTTSTVQVTISSGSFSQSTNLTLIVE